MFSKQALYVFVVAGMFVFLLGTNALKPNSVYAQGATTAWIADFSGRASLSEDGQLIAYTDQIDHPELGDTNGRSDIYVYNRTNLTTQLISKNSSNVSVSANSDDPVISTNGRYVFFEAYDDVGGPWLVPQDTDNHWDIFMYDRQANTISLLSTEQTDCNDPHISNDARYVVYKCTGAITLLDRQTSTASDIYVNVNGQTPNDNRVGEVVISGDASRIAYFSWASDLVNGDTNNTIDAFVYTRNNAQTQRVSLTSSNTQSLGDTDDGINHFKGLSISDDGNKVLFVSTASDLLGSSADTNGSMDVFLRNLTTNQTSRISTGTNGAQGNDFSMWPFISGNGQYATFATSSSTIIGSGNGYAQLVIKNLQTGTIELISTGSSGGLGNNSTKFGVISDSTGSIAFNSDATNLVPNHTTPGALYVRDLPGNVAKKPIVVLVHGWLGIGDAESRCSQDIQPYPEGLANDKVMQGWNEIAEDLESEGFNVWVAHLQSGKNEGTLKIEENSKCLKDQLEKIKGNLAQGDGYHIIAHSMGGLVSEACAELNVKTGELICPQYIKTITTLGTPFNGVPTEAMRLVNTTLYHTVELVASSTDPAAYQMLETQISKFHETYPNRKSGVRYYAIGGNIPYEQTKGLARVLALASANTDDGYVETGSSTGLAYVTWNHVTSDAHSKGWGPSWYGSTLPNQEHTQSYNCITTFVANQNMNGCTGGVGAATNAPSINTFSPLTVGVLNAGQEKVENVLLDQAGSAIFVAHASQSGSFFSLISPNGTIINEAYAQAHPSEVTYTADGILLYEVQNAQTGTWHLKLNTQSKDTKYTLFAGFQSGINLTAMPNKNSYSADETVAVTAQLTGANQPASATLELTLPNGSKQSYMLTLQSSNYSVQFTPQIPGYYSGIVKLNGTTELGPYSREKIIVFEVVQTQQPGSTIYLPIVIK